MLHKWFLAMKTCHEIYNRSQRKQLSVVTLDLSFFLKMLIWNYSIAFDENMHLQNKRMYGI